MTGAGLEEFPPVAMGRAVGIGAFPGDVAGHGIGAGQIQQHLVRGVAAIIVGIATIAIAIAIGITANVEEQKIAPKPAVAKSSPPESSMVKAAATGKAAESSGPESGAAESTCSETIATPEGTTMGTCAAKAPTVTSSEAAAAASQRFVIGEHQTPENQGNAEYCLFPHDILSRHDLRATMTRQMHRRSMGA